MSHTVPPLTVCITKGLSLRTAYPVPCPFGSTTSFKEKWVECKNGSSDYTADFGDRMMAERGLPIVGVLKYCNNDPRQLQGKIVTRDGKFWWVHPHLNFVRTENGRIGPPKCCKWARLLISVKVGQEVIFKPGVDRCDRRHATNVTDRSGGSFPYSWVCTFHGLGLPVWYNQRKECLKNDAGDGILDDWKAWLNEMESKGGKNFDRILFPHIFNGRRFYGPKDIEKTPGTPDSLNAAFYGCNGFFDAIQGCMCWTNGGIPINFKGEFNVFFPDPGHGQIDRVFIGKMLALFAERGLKPDSGLKALCGPNTYGRNGSDGKLNDDDGHYGQ